MNTTQYVSLEIISVNHQQEFLSRFGHPYRTQDKDNSKVEYTHLGKGILEELFEADKILQPLLKADLSGQIHLGLISETSLSPLKLIQLNEDKPNLQLNETRIQYLQKLGCSRQFYNRVYKAKQNS